MSCQGAADYYDDHNGTSHTPLSEGHVTHIGRFRCHVYEDLTPPEQDSDVRVRCVHGEKAFRFEYSV